MTNTQGSNEQKVRVLFAILSKCVYPETLGLCASENTTAEMVFKQPCRDRRNAQVYADDAKGVNTDRPPPFDRPYALKLCLCRDDIGNERWRNTKNNTLSRSIRSCAEAVQPPYFQRSPPSLPVISLDAVHDQRPSLAIFGSR